MKISKKLPLYLLLFVGIFLLNTPLQAQNKKPKKEKKAKTEKKEDKKGKVYKKNVVACYYHDKFNGRKTASGAIFDNKKQTAAHKKLPFGTQVKVTNKANGKWVLVTINDRGPFSKGKEIDLSKKAFMDITEDPKKGNLKVDIEIVK
ncbi:MAG: septal ring lytic transglycosylase RlpA family protein [Bacteroidota bacterium]|nr:septal ring lytic transglycosylase RlpA family protein [Bacteroidota bacterium]